MSFSQLEARNLASLGTAQFETLRTLTVSDQQEVMGKSFLESIADWEKLPPERVLGLCFLIADQPVGLVLFQRGATPSDPAYVPTATIHGLKIASQWQGQGLGHIAFRLAVEQLKLNWPDMTLLKLSVDAVNRPAIAIYQGYGMTDSGPVFDGPNGREHRMELSLTS